MTAPARSGYRFDWHLLSEEDKKALFPTFKFIAQMMLKDYQDSLTMYPEGYHTKKLEVYLDAVNHGLYECECGHKKEELIEAQQAKLKEF